jgi:hypothetical protein
MLWDLTWAYIMYGYDDKYTGVGGNKIMRLVLDGLEVTAL